MLFETIKLVTLATMGKAGTLECLVLQIFAKAKSYNPTSLPSFNSSWYRVSAMDYARLEA